MKEIAKILSLVLVVLLLLPLAKIDYDQEFMGFKVEMKEYMNYFSLGLGLDQTIKSKSDDEVDKSKPDLSGSFLVLIAIVVTIFGALLLNGLDLKLPQMDYVKIGVYALLTLILILLPSSVHKLKLDDVQVISILGKESVKMTLFYFLSLLSAIGITGIFIKEKFLDQ
ncbi:MAG: hypothetical protein JXR88_00725 [Clostridia bacterium]|nr:hypothetical protein [Clostridia bacterium]